jgi:cyclophilin family peptidyl-prolyl cis-trans isomerase
MRPAALPITVSIVITAGIIAGAIFYQTRSGPSSGDLAPPPVAAPSASSGPSGAPEAAPSPGAATSPGPLASGIPPSNPNPDLSVDASGLSKASVVINTPRGRIVMKLYAADAPETVKRFVELINQGFYNGLTFHRVVPNFAVQGGDPQGTGQGGSGKRLKPEFNARPHVEGAVGMARDPRDPESADSQFYIMLSRQPHLDRTYTVFGQVIEGMDVVRQIQKDDRMTWVIVQ